MYLPFQHRCIFTPQAFLFSYSVTRLTEVFPLVHTADSISESDKSKWLFFCSRSEQDSGHDSGSEDACLDSSQPFTLVTLGMKKFFIPKAAADTRAAADPKDPASRILPLPSCMGICLDCDNGKVGFYDASHMKCLYECEVECSGIMYPTFALMGGAAIHLMEAIPAKYLEYQDDL